MLVATFMIKLHASVLSDSDHINKIAFLATNLKFLLFNNVYMEKSIKQ